MQIAKVTWVFLALIILNFTALSAHAAGPFGVWVRHNGVHIKVYECNKGLGMKIVKASKRENVGKIIMCGAKANGDKKWKGEILNVEDGKTYSGFVTLTSANVLKLEGCVFGGLFCKTDTWKRFR